MTPQGGAARVFFALWPAPSVRDELARWGQQAQRECGGRATPKDKLHLTLAFLGDVEAGRLGELKSAAATIAAQPFEFVIDQLGYWRHNRIIWAAPVTVPAALAALVAALESALSTAGYSFDQRQYAAHITLVRNARRATEFSPVPLRWEVDEFALVSSTLTGQGSQYEIIGRWPLQNVCRGDAAVTP